MIRIYQTIIVTIALLFSMQSTQAAAIKPVADGNFGLLTFGGSPYSDEIEIPKTIDPRVIWYQFELGDAANVTLDTNDSQSTDTILALYNDDVDGTLYDQNDDCGSEVWSCLTASNLEIGTYLVGVTFYENNRSPFLDGWTLPANTGTFNRYAELNISISPVPVPAAVWLFGTALIGFIGMSRRTNVKA